MRDWWDAGTDKMAALIRIIDGVVTRTWSEGAGGVEIAR